MYKEQLALNTTLIFIVCLNFYDACDILKVTKQILSIFIEIEQMSKIHL
jgi:hypothetical protein